MAGVEYQVTKVDPTDPETKGMVYQVHKVSEEVAATLGGKVYRARIINNPSDTTVAGKVYQIVLIGDPDDPAVKGKVYNAILTGGSEVVVIGPAVSPLALDDAIADTLAYVKAYGGTELRTSLPDGYTQLEYITFDGTQVIDTGFTPDNETRIESRCLRTGSNCWFYGASFTNPRVTLFHSDSGTSRWGNQSRSSFGFAANTDYVLIQDKNGLSINGTSYAWSSGAAGDFTCGNTLAIGNCNGASGTAYFSGNFYYMKIYNNGVLARDFVPCKNASNVVGLYDRANGVFYTDAGLVAGPDAVPTPDYPMNIVTNNGALKARHQSGLPLGYTLLDYIESIGGQFLTNQGTGDFTAGNTVSDPVKIYTDGTVETIEDTIGNTATAEMLLKVGDYQDVQEVLSGAVTRNVGIKVLDGTEGWVQSAATNNLFYATISGSNTDNTYVPISSHFQGVVASTGYATMTNGQFKHGSNTNSWYFKDASCATATEFSQFLASQYAAGTPVIVVYPLATATAESVTGQTLQVQDGDNTLEITQASIDGLELEAEYEKEAE